MISTARERLLARQAGRGDRRALQLLYQEYAEELFAAAYRLTQSSADARDVLHDVFIELPRTLRRFDRARPLRPWLRSVTTHATLEHLRSERRRRKVSLESLARELTGENTPELPVLDSIVVERALSSLPEGLRTVVVLKEMEGYSHEEIAGLLKISCRTSQGRLYNARKLLRARLER